MSLPGSTHSSYGAQNWFNHLIRVIHEVDSCQSSHDSRFTIHPEGSHCRSSRLCTVQDSGIRFTVTYFSSSWRHRNLAHPSKTKIKQFVCVTFKPALRASQIGIVPHPTQYMYCDVYICISIHLFREILNCWSDIHFIFAWNTTTIPHCYCFCCWSSFAVTHQTSILLVVSVRSKEDLPPVAPLDVTACFPDRSRSAITVRWVVKNCLFLRPNR